MFKHIIRFAFILSLMAIVSCSQSDNSDGQVQQVNRENTPGGKVVIKEVPYPMIFTDTQIPIIDDARVVNSQKLTNSKNKVGMKVWEKSDKSFDDVRDFYLDAFESNGWTRKTDADKQSTPEQERDEAPTKYFVTKFHKVGGPADKRFITLLNITSGNDGKITIIKILKEM